MVTRMDREVGRILDLVRELGLDERTIVVFTSDNGPTLRAHRRLGLGVLPLGGPAARAQGLALRGRRPRAGDRAVDGADPGRPRQRARDRLRGLAADAAGPGRREGGHPAGDRRPELRPRPCSARRRSRGPFLYREFPGYGGQQSVRVGDWKGVRQGLEKPGPLRLELYDLEGRRRRDARRGGGAPRRRRADGGAPLPRAPAVVGVPDPGDRRGDAPLRRRAERRRRPEPCSMRPRAPGPGRSASPGGPRRSPRASARSGRSAGLAVRFDVTDPSPWHTLTQRDERLWNEEVVELFLDVGATGRSYAEVEWNPVNAVVDLWVDRAREPVRQGLERRRPREPRPPAEGRRRATRPAGPPSPSCRGRRSRRRRRRARRCRRRRATAGASTSSASSAPAGRRSPEKDAQYLAWSPTGNRSFHVPLAFRELVFAERRAGRRGT